MDRLADELLVAIFTCVERVDDLLTCVCVNQTWQRILWDTSLWEKRNLSHEQIRMLMEIYGTNMPIDIYETTVPMCTYTLLAKAHDLVLPQARHLTSRTMEVSVKTVVYRLSKDIRSLNLHVKCCTELPLVRSYPRLTHLELVFRDPRYLNDVLYSGPFHTWPLPCCHKQQSWQVRWILQQSALTHLTCQILNTNFLRKMTDDAFSRLVVVSVVHINGRALELVIQRSCLTLQSLSIGRIAEEIYRHGNALFPLLAKCKQLTTFQLHVSVSVDDACRDLTSLTTLRSLSLTTKEPIRNLDWLPSSLTCLITGRDFFASVPIMMDSLDTRNLAAIETTFTVLGGDGNRLHKWAKSRNRHVHVEVGHLIHIYIQNANVCDKHKFHCISPPMLDENHQ